jgi:ankyrin repeat protein
MWPLGKQRFSKPDAASLRRASLSLLALVSVSAPAADRCTVSEFVVGVPDGRADRVSGGFQSMAPPQVQFTTVHHSSVPVAAGVVVPIQSTRPSARTPAPRPPRPPPHNDQDALFTAVYYGDLEDVRRLLNSPDIDVNAPARSDLRRSLIDVAAMVAQPQITRMLIEHGARVRGPVPGVDVHPIAVAMLNLKTTIQFHGDPVAFSVSPERSPADFEATVRVLLEAGADADGELDPTHPDSALGLLLTTPRFDGDLRIARLLLDHGAQIGAAAPGGSPLAIAVAQGREDFVDLALDARKVDRSALDAALASAVARQNGGMVAKLLDAGASPDSHDVYGQPVLCWGVFAQASPRSVATLLLLHGARLDISCAGQPPLNLAIKDHELALLMIDHGADPSRVDRNGAAALDLVADADHALVDAIISHRGRLGQPSQEARNLRDMRVADPGPTVRAILGHKDYVASRLLLRDGLVGDTPCAAVIYAAATGASATLAELLRQGADANSMTDGGITALMAAAYHGEDEALRVLLAQRRIDVDHTTPIRVNPGALALYSEDPEPLRTGHRTALMYAAATGHTVSIAMLLQHGASTRKSDAEGRKAIEYARSVETRNELLGAPR